MSELKQMYKGQVNSPITTITNDITADQTVLVVNDGSVLPEAPNLLVIGDQINAETVLMTKKDIDKITVVRGIEGTKKGWNEGTVIARNYTNYDHNTFIENINKNNESIIKNKEDINKNNESISNHLADKKNPHEVTKQDIGLGKVDNTSDLDKPVSKATQEELNKLSTNIKVEKERIDGLSEVVVESGNSMTQSIQALEKEVDKVKQSGVESNKILVDNLASKGVTTSTSNTIRENVEKVKDIQVGDYSIGDTLNNNQIVITNRFKTPKITINRDDTQCVTILDEYVYAFTRNYLWKYDIKGSYIGSASLSNSGWSGICESSNNAIYLGRSTKLSKYSTDCKLVWEVDTQRQITALKIIGSNVVVGNENGYINEYNSSGALVKKGSPGTSDIIDITSYKGSMYCTNSNYVMKLNADLSKYEEIGSKGHFIDIRDDIITGIEMDSYGNYADFYKLDMSGTIIDRCIAHRMSRRNSVQIAYFEDNYIVYRYNGGVTVVDRDFNTIYTWSSADSVNLKAISVNNGHIAVVSSDKLFILHPISDSSIKIIK